MSEDVLDPTPQTAERNADAEVREQGPSLRARRAGRDDSEPSRSDTGSGGGLHSLKAKLTVMALGVTVLLCVTWFGAFMHFSSVTNDAASLELTASQIRHQVAAIRLIEEEILQEDVHTPEFYGEQGTAHLTAHAEAIETLRAHSQRFTSLIEDRAAIEDPTARVRSLPVLIRRYESEFNQLIVGHKELGASRWGLIGDLRDTAAEIHDNVEMVDDPLLTALWLEARGKEKDLLGRPGPYFEQQANELYGHLNMVAATLGTSDSLAADEIRAQVQTYRAAFAAIVEAQKLLGFTGDQGVRGMLALTFSEVTKAAGDAMETAEQVHLRAREEQTYYNVLISLAGLVGTAAAFFLLAGSITGPIAEVKDAALTVAGGHLDVRLKHSGRDEVGILRDAFNRMIGGLRGANEQLREGASKVTASVAQLSASTTEVSASSAQTSAAMTQAVATIETVKDSVRTTTVRSKHVSSISQDAAGVAESGRDAARNSIEGIENIQREMEDIAQSIMALNEQGQAIAEIISTVNDLAERSNLLAVNAAIEAAKAGEEGRGFVVVADEIKGLAEQSKRSTAEVRTILNKIQKDTAASVMAAERGRKAVDHGILQARDAVDAIQTLGSVVEEVAHDATEISTSMQQVDASVNQVFTAMASVLAAAQQNEGAIGDVDAAIKSLESTAQELHEKAERYKS